MHIIEYTLIPCIAWYFWLVLAWYFWLVLAWYFWLVLAWFQPDTFGWFQPGAGADCPPALRVFASSVVGVGNHGH